MLKITPIPRQTKTRQDQARQNRWFSWWSPWSTIRPYLPMAMSAGHRSRSMRSPSWMVIKWQLLNNISLLRSMNHVDVFGSLDCIRQARTQSREQVPERAHFFEISWALSLWGGSPTHTCGVVPRLGNWCWGLKHRGKDLVVVMLLKVSIMLCLTGEIFV